MDILGYTLLIFVLSALFIFVVCLVFFRKRKYEAMGLSRYDQDSEYDPELEYRRSLPLNVRVGQYRDPYARSYDQPVVIVEDRPLIFMDRGGVAADVIPDIQTVPDGTGYSGFGGGDSGGGGATSDWGGSSDSGSCDASSSDSGSCDAGGSF